jgi:hypothetical protein
MELKDYIEQIEIKPKYTRVFEKASECKHYCINILNRLVFEKTGGRKQLELTQELEYIYNCLFAYLDRDERVQDASLPYASEKWDLSKGLLIIGEYGSGKTLILDFLRQVKGKFDISGRHTTAYEICREYEHEQKNKGHEGYQDILKSRCLFIDEVGDEPAVSKSYGNEENVIYRTLKLKFDLIERQKEKDKVFITSNLSIPEFRERYGDRLFDRIKGCMNILILGTGENHKSKRT